MMNLNGESKKIVKGENPNYTRLEGLIILKLNGRVIRERGLVQQTNRNTLVRPMLLFAGLFWSLPTTLIGLSVGGLCLLTRGRVQRKGRVLEFHGGFVTWSLSKMPIRPMAMTLGHVIIGLDENCLDICRDHEMVHVKQCERWGPFFLPAYLLSSAVIWIRRGDAYLDNPFERQAYAISDPANRLTRERPA